MCCSAHWLVKISVIGWMYDWIAWYVLSFRWWKLYVQAKL